MGGGSVKSDTYLSTCLSGKLTYVSHFSAYFGVCITFGGKLDISFTGNVERVPDQAAAERICRYFKEEIQILEAIAGSDIQMESKVETAINIE